MEGQQRKFLEPTTTFFARAFVCLTFVNIIAMQMGKIAADSAVSLCRTEHIQCEEKFIHVRNAVQ